MIKTAALWPDSRMFSNFGFLRLRRATELIFGLNIDGGGGGLKDAESNNEAKNAIYRPCQIPHFINFTPFVQVFSTDEEGRTAETVLGVLVE